MQVQLSWKDPSNQTQQQTICTATVALGRRLKGMPPDMDKQLLSRVVLDNEEVSRFHALMTFDGNQVVFEDRSTNGTLHNGWLLHQDCTLLSSGDTLHIGPYCITVILAPTSLACDPIAAPASSETLPSLDPSSLNISTNKRDFLPVEVSKFGN